MCVAICRRCSLIAQACTSAFCTTILSRMVPCDLSSFCHNTCKSCVQSTRACLAMIPSKAIQSARRGPVSWGMWLRTVWRHGIGSKYVSRAMA